MCSFLFTLTDFLPSDWTCRTFNKDYRLIELSPSSQQYKKLASEIKGKFNLGTGDIVRVESPYLYTRFMLKCAEYESRGSADVFRLYHDTSENNIESIVSTNLDWRLANRVKYGKGVSFSPFPSYANQESSRSNGAHRAMIIADVLIDKCHPVEDSRTLPVHGCDTTVGNNKHVIVKYYDDEFYPTYIAYYKSKPRCYHRRYK